MRACAPVPISNPPNPWATTEVEYLEGAPEVQLEVYEDHTRRSSRRTTAPTSASAAASTPTAAASTPAPTATRARRTSTSASARAPTSTARSWSSRSAPELLRAAFAKKCWQRETVVFSGVTDCYQPLEASYRLTRGCLEVCVEYREPGGDHHQGAADRARHRRAGRAGARRRGARHRQHPVLGPGAGARDRAVRRHAAAPAARHRDAGAGRASRWASTSRRSSRASTTRTSRRSWPPRATRARRARAACCCGCPAR